MKSQIILIKYVKQLDSLRAIAVLLVIISHWVPTTNFVNRIMPNGEVGVDIFFVLSGFLITKILLDNRNNTEITGNRGWQTVIKSFYIRRALRIFPIYYIVIIILFLCAESTGTSIKGSFAYFATYTGNFYFFKTKSWDGMLSPLWSLSVEEQFYLIWPWLILLVRKKYLLHVILGFILLGVISQHLLNGVAMSHVVTFNCFDAFGIGALLSWQITFVPEKTDKFYSVLCWLAIISFMLFVAGLATGKWLLFPIRTCIGFITGWIIMYILINRESHSNIFRYFFNNKILIFLGKISYGLYLYHTVVVWLNSKLINKYINPLLPDILFKEFWGQLFLFENAMLLLLIAWLSYMMIEKRFLNLKKHFEY